MGKPTRITVNKQQHHEQYKQDFQKARYDRQERIEDVFASPALSLLHDYSTAVLPCLPYISYE